MDESSIPVNSPTRLQAVVTDSDWPDLTYESMGMAGRHDLRHVRAADASDIVRTCRDAQVLLVQRLRINAELFDSLPRLRAIVRYGMGLDNIDVHAAQQRGIRVLGVPDYCVKEVAEHTCMFISAAARHLWTGVRSAEAGEWGYKSGPLPKLSQDDPVGVVGFGRIGAEVSSRLLQLGHPVHIYDPNVPASVLPDGATRANSVEQLAEAVNHLTLHVPVTPQTEGMVGPAVLERLGPTGHLVNTARGRLINEPALLRALNSGQLGHASLDVLGSEPPGDLQRALITHGRVTVTPHVAYLSDTSLPRLRERAGALAGDLLDDVLSDDLSIREL